MKAGDFAKWTAEENGEKFSHVGQIVKLDDKWVALQTNEGLMEFRANDGKLEPHKAIDLNVKAKKEIEAAPKAEKVKVKREKSTDGSSKQDLVIEIVKTNPDASRKELIELVVKKLGMTPAGASTYVYNAKKALGK